MRFNHFLLFLFCSVILQFASACSSKKEVLVDHLDPKEQGERFLDSLEKAGVDTAISYRDGCSGCFENAPEPHYLMWSDSSYWSVIKFTKWGTYGPVKQSGFPISFLSGNFGKIRDDTLSEPEYILSHFPYEEVRARIDDLSMEYRVKSYEKGANQLNYRVLLIDKIRSYLFEIPEAKWRPIKNVKTEKKDF